MLKINNGKETKTDCGPFNWNMSMQQRTFSNVGPQKAGLLSCFHEYRGWESQLTHVLMLKKNISLDWGGHPTNTSSRDLSVKPLTEQCAVSSDSMYFDGSYLDGHYISDYLFFIPWMRLLVFLPWELCCPTFAAQCCCGWEGGCPWRSRRS